MMANKIAGPLTQLATFATSIEQFVLAVKNLSDILNSHGERRKRGVSPRISGAIEFKNVYFEYQKDIPIVNDLSFQIKSREKIGIIGPSGCGKSTLGKLFEGILFPYFMRPNEYDAMTTSAFWSSITSVDLYNHAIWLYYPVKVALLLFSCLKLVSMKPRYRTDREDVFR